MSEEDNGTYKKDGLQLLQKHPFIVIKLKPVHGLLEVLIPLLKVTEPIESQAEFNSMP